MILKKKIIPLILSVATVVICFSYPSYAYEREEHDKYMLEVLFRNFREIENDISVEDEIKTLCCASYLTIDQFNSYGQTELNILHGYGVENIPSEISKISFNASGNTHRSYTHRGWDYPYSGVAGEVWPVRKEIMLNTVDEIFDFEGNEEKKESFCALIYYIHILGDHMDDSSYVIKNGHKIEVGGRVDKDDIIHELLKHIEILFEDQKHTHKYRSLTGALERYNNRLSKIVRSEGGINTEEKFEEKKKYTEGIMNLLTMYIPEMLKSEKFFSDVFYN